ncbi:MAG: polysaccharide pyruvyl transferase family protein [Methanofollis sp.]|nr:polysaccharide pyruvyl transferase family protein [Methanofollis sp.]
MVEILVINSMGMYSFGGRAVIQGFIISIQENVPDAHITFISSHYGDDLPVYQQWEYEGVQVVDHTWYKDSDSFGRSLILSGFSGFFILCRMYAGRLLRSPDLLPSIYRNCDAIVDLTTDGPNDHYPLHMALFSLFNTYLATLSGKPVIVSAASIGEFKNKFLEKIARSVLNRVALITTREEITYNYLQDGLWLENPEIQLTADHAFLMEPSSPEHIKDILVNEGLDGASKPFIGITVSSIIHRYAFQWGENIDERQKIYLEVMTRVVQEIVRRELGTILIIPHAYSLQKNMRDDKMLSQDLFDACRGRGVRLLQGSYDANEVKGVIGKCAIFLGCRMHATIAAMSMFVPTVAVVYGHKSHGILGKMLEMEKYIISVENYRPDELYEEIIRDIDEILANKELIQDQLTKNIFKTRCSALKNGECIRETIERSQTLK